MTLDADDHAVRRRDRACRHAAASAQPAADRRCDRHDHRWLRDHCSRAYADAAHAAVEQLVPGVVLGHCGVDPYTFHVSDVYQDLFGRGSFTGKGMYEVDAFEAALRGRMPADAILSHDLLEGSYARCGFVSDIERSRVSRQEPPRRAATGGTRRLAAALDRGRRSRELRRSPMEDARQPAPHARGAESFCCASWIVEGAGGQRSACSRCWRSCCDLLALVDWLVPRPNTDRGNSLRMLRDDVLQVWPHAVPARDAAARLRADARRDRPYTGRLVVRQRLLEWNSAAQVQASASMTLTAVRNMYAALAITACALFVLLLANASAILVAAPFLVLWFAAPIFAWRASQPALAREVESPTPEQAAELRLIARQTWQYFADLAGPEDHFLPPDNLQVDPDRVVAHRTSPTNIGMYVVSTVAAHEFGWIGLPEVCERIEAVLGTLAKLPRHRGHFFNWVETTTLRSLEPRYVSTVDSGNLAGCLVALSSAARSALTRPAIEDNALQGVADDVALLRRAIERADRKRVDERQRRPVAGGPRGRRRMLLSARSSAVVAGRSSSGLRATSSTRARYRRRRRARNADRRRDRRRRPPRRHRQATRRFPPAGAVVRRAGPRCAVGPAFAAARHGGRARRARNSRRRAARRATGALRGAAAQARDIGGDSARRARRVQRNAAPCRARRRAADRAAAAHRARGARALHRDGFPVPVRPDAPAVLDRLPVRQRAARSVVLRPAGVGGAACELHRDRQARRAARALVRLDAR